jgi:hypothetical protein
MQRQITSLRKVKEPCSSRRLVIPQCRVGYIAGCPLNSRLVRMGAVTPKVPGRRRPAIYTILTAEIGLSHVIFQLQ